MATFSATQRELVSTNPANPDEVLGKVAVSTNDDVIQAVAGARSAQTAWRNLGAEGRVKELRKFYEYVVAHRANYEKLETLEMGRAIKVSRGAMDWALAQFLWNLDNASKVLSPAITHEDDSFLHQVFYEPYGVSGVIAPWNFPLINWIMGALQPLLAGNTVVYKASEEVPLCAQLIADTWTKAGLPEGVFRLVQGGPEVGEMLARADINFLDFTGSTNTGQSLYKIAAEKFIPVRLELGGSSAGIVFEDASIDAILEPIFWAKFDNSGQCCSGLKRLYVQRAIFDIFVEKFTAFVRQQKNGNPQDENTVIGPLVSKRQQTLLSEQVEDAKAKGATILLGGKIPPMSGAYYETTLMTGVTREMRAYREELFGPVLPIWAFGTEEEAVRLANDSMYGLSARIYTNDQNRFDRLAAQLEAGAVSCNGADYTHPANPFGGYKMSGIGRVCGAVGLQHCCQIKAVSRRKLPLSAPGV